MHVARAAGTPRVDHRSRGHGQEPARLGVREVPRRRRGHGLVEPRAFPGLRGRRHLLGARRDGPGALRPGGDRRRGRDADQGPGDARAHRPGPGRARMGGAGDPRAAGRRGHGRGRRRAVRALADPVRAPVRLRHRRPRVRGPAVGRRRHARLHRPPAGLVQGHPAAGGDPRPSRAARHAAVLGSRAPRLRRAAPGSAARAGDAGAAARPRARSPGRRGAQDHRAGRRHPPVCRRDGPDAGRRQAPGAAGQRLRAGGRHLHPGRAGDPDRPDRCAPRHPGAGRSGPRPRRRGAGPALHRGRPRGGVGHGRRGAGAEAPRPASVARSSASRRIRGPRSEASTGSCRRSSARSPTTRWPAGTGRRATWPPPGSSKSSARTSWRAPWPATTSRHTPTPATARRRTPWPPRPGSPCVARQTGPPPWDRTRRPRRSCARR